ncbi:MAG: type IV pilus twitching motility protein PilT [bacterium]|nr:type IV pilus twitching motility protein PilT [bacterium]
MTIEELLQITIQKNASDLHLIAYSEPTLRIHGVLTPVPQSQPLMPEEVESLIMALVTEEQKELLVANKELDFSFALGEVARFRVNAYYQKGYVSAALRMLPLKIRNLDELQLPSILHKFTDLVQGFVLVTGPTGHGKSTTLAALVNEINQNRACHILTIEDPIEYVYPKAKAFVSQRELHLDTHSWDVALRGALREDPDVVLIGEMRDYETIEAAITIAETGHLVFSTLHTNSAAQAIDRMVDVFPEHQQDQVRLQLASTLEAIVSQRLLPSLNGERIVVNEILLANSAVKTIIREGKTHLLDNVIQTNSEMGMESMESALARKVRAGTISLHVAQTYSNKAKELTRLLNSGKPSR